MRGLLSAHHCSMHIHFGIVSFRHYLLWKVLIQSWLRSQMRNILVLQISKKKKISILVMVINFFNKKQCFSCGCPKGLVELFSSNFIQLVLEFKSWTSRGFKKQYILTFCHCISSLLKWIKQKLYICICVHTYIRVFVYVYWFLLMYIPPFNHKTKGFVEEFSGDSTK